MEIDHPEMFYSRITQFTVLTLLTLLQAVAGILVTSASKHIGWDQYDKVRVHSASTGQGDCKKNSIKSFPSLKVKHHLAQMSESDWRKTKRRSGTNGVCFGGFNCRCSCADNSMSTARGEFVPVFEIKVKGLNFTKPCPNCRFLSCWHLSPHWQLSS